MPLWTPVYLPLAAGALRAAGHEVSIVECGHLAAGPPAAATPPLRRFRDALLERPPEAVVFEMPLEHLDDVGDLAAAAREAAPGALILAGGRHPTLLPRETLDAHPALDGVIVGEPEATLVELAGVGKLAGLAGTAARDGGQAVAGPRREPIADLDRVVPPPALDLLDMAYHTGRTLRAIPCLPLRTATILSSRGCAASCRFCSEGRLYPAPHRWHGAARVVAIIEDLVARYGVEGVYFQDETFLGNRDRVLELCGELARSGLASRVAWSAQARTDAVDAEVLAAMRRGGCVQLELGVESGSQRLLDELAKGETVEDHERAFALARGAGIRTLASVMVGTPGERLEDVRLTDELLGRLRPTVVRLVRYIPMPGTALVRSLVERGRLPERFWERGRYRGSPHGGPKRNLSEMSDEELRRAERSLYRRRALPAYAADLVRYAGARDWASLLRSGFLPRLLARRFLGRRGP